MKILFLLLSCWSLSSLAQSDDFHMRVSWVKTLKELLLEIEKNHPEKLSVYERTFLKRFRLFNEAHADARFDCFYGGWPSKRGVSGLCALPTVSNPLYSKGSCKENEIQCQPMLFGKNLCVSFKTKEDRRGTFQNCERKFQTDKQGSYDFLMNPTREEASELREISSIAQDVCGENSKAPQKGTPICHKILKKVKDGLKSIDRAFVTAETTMMIQRPRARAPASHNPEDCDEEEHNHDSIKSLSHDVGKTVTKSLDSLYEEMKEKFQKSPFCDPLKIVNDPGERTSGVVLSKLMSDMKEIDYIGNKNGTKREFLKALGKKYSISESAQNTVLPLLDSLRPFGSNEEERKKNVARIKGIILQDVTSRPSQNVNDSELKMELAKHHIFKKNEDGAIECPFVSKDAFLKAMMGHQNVLKRMKVGKSSQITIVDYTRPSNERRMFVIDLNSHEVIHNTWVAHGLGGDSAKGVDGLGSSPKMSNRPGSNMSSDGFILATTAASGSKFGPNVLLKGIDTNNTNLEARSVVLHGWQAPMTEYTQGLQDYNWETEQYSEPYDVIARLKNTDFNKASTKEMEKAIWGVKSATSAAPYMAPTEGCLGVPTTNIKHLDLKGRNKTQLELLREDLPGSIIFNYSGPQMESKFLN